jgi:hypothetical protein
MNGICGGTLEAYVPKDEVKAIKKSAVQRPDNIYTNQGEFSNRFEVVPMCELIATLFPNEASVYQCYMCGKLVPKSELATHICERNDMCILNINFHRQSYNKYLCKTCNGYVHSAFLYPHADLHNHNYSTLPSREDIRLMTSLIIQNDSKINDKNLNCVNKSDKKPSGDSNSPRRLKKDDMPCLSSPLVDLNLPSKRHRQSDEVETLDLIF